MWNASSLPLSLWTPRLLERFKKNSHNTLILGPGILLRIIIEVKASSVSIFIYTYRQTDRHIYKYFCRFELLILNIWHFPFTFYHLTLLKISHWNIPQISTIPQPLILHITCIHTRHAHPVTFCTQNSLRENWFTRSSIQFLPLCAHFISLQCTPNYYTTPPKCFNIFQVISV